MGFIKHNAIVVTSGSDETIQAAVAIAKGFGCTVLGPSDQVVNGYCTMVVCPDGSKEGWTDSDEGDERREHFKAWLNKVKVSWVEVAFGGDLESAYIEGERNTCL